MDESERWAYSTHQLFRLLTVAVKGLIAALIVFLAVPLPVRWGAGQETIITLTYQAILTGSPSNKVKYGTIGVLIILLYVQRWHYTRRLKHLGERNKNLELQLDERRSSSRPRT